MKVRPGFELVEVGDEFMLIPVGDNTNQFQGIVSVNDETAYLLRNMTDDISVDMLVDLLIKEYEVDTEKAREDIGKLLQKLNAMGVLCD